jgi:uncharacterized protein YbaA (DUF1428 family)
MGYVDLYLLPIAEDRLDDYIAVASAFGAVAREHGALSYREFRADDPGERFGAMAGAGQLLTAAVVDFESREHRDEVMAKVIADPRVNDMGDDAIADMEQMRYGGFATIVDA